MFVVLGGRHGPLASRACGAADKNGDGMVDLKSEYVFGPCYYAAAFDRSGTKSTNYTNTMFDAFLDGRKLITAAAGDALSDSERSQLKAYAATIEENWEKVLAEAVFKYAGSVYKDINKMKDLSGDDLNKAYRTYAKHWGELKGFAMAMQSGKSNLGATATKMNELIGFGPVTLNNSYVTGMDSNGNFVMDRKKSWSDYQLHMLKIQQMMVDQFSVKARANDGLNDLQALTDKLDSASSAETD